MNQIIPPDKVAALSSDDLVDYDYKFCISEQRILRNSLVGVWDLSDFRGFSCYNVALESRGPVVVCLSTMAIGDHNAVEYGQSSHLMLSDMLHDDHLCIRMDRKC